jgi:hypothetical protein
MNWLLTLLLVLTAPPEAPSVQYVRARIALDAGRFTECASGFEHTARQVTRSRGEPVALWYAATCELGAGRLDAAEALVRRAVKRGLRDLDERAADDVWSSLRARPGWAKLVRASRANADRFRKKNNARLLAIYREDQADRRGEITLERLEQIARHDEVRREQLRPLLAQARTADDFFHAAMVLQHSQTANDHREANRLALRAVALDEHFFHARSLAAASEDRYLLQIGKPQRFGTQTQQDESGKLVRRSMDESTTDEERMLWGVKPIAP